MKIGHRQAVDEILAQEGAMVTTINNVLIVEDEDDWCAIYERTARREGVSTIKVAKTSARPSV